MGYFAYIRRIDQRIGSARRNDQSLRDHLAHLSSRTGNVTCYLAADTLELLDRLEAAEGRISALEAANR